MLRSIAEVLKIDIAIPDHTTLSRRGGGVTILPKRGGLRAAAILYGSVLHTMSPSAIRQRAGLAVRWVPAQSWAHCTPC